MQNEITWEELSVRAGRSVTEKTTVTKKTRRVAEWDDDLFKQSCVLNNPTEIALTFADYVDPKLLGKTNAGDAVRSEVLQSFLDHHIPSPWREKIKYIGTGPATVMEVADV